jgi:hypothetical protein
MVCGNEREHGCDWTRYLAMPEAARNDKNGARRDRDLDGAGVREDDDLDRAVENMQKLVTVDVALPGSTTRKPPNRDAAPVEGSEFWKGLTDLIDCRIRIQVDFRGVVER